MRHVALLARMGARKGAYVHLLVLSKLSVEERTDSPDERSAVRAWALGGARILAAAAAAAAAASVTWRNGAVRDLKGWPLI